MLDLINDLNLVSWWTNQRILFVGCGASMLWFQLEAPSAYSQQAIDVSISIMHSSLNSSNFSFQSLITSACRFRSTCRRSSWGRFGRRRHLPRRWQSDRLSSSWGGRWWGALEAGLTSLAPGSICPVLALLPWSGFVHKTKVKVAVSACRNTIYGRGTYIYSAE